MQWKISLKLLSFRFNIINRHKIAKKPQTDNKKQIYQKKVTKEQKQKQKKEKIAI